MAWSVTRSLFVLLALGGTLGTMLDRLHVATGTTAYADPGPYGQPYWVPPLFAGAAAALGGGRLLFGSRGTSAPSFDAAAAAVGGLVIAYVASAVLPWLLASSVLAVLAALLFVRFDRTSRGLVHAGASAIAGTAVESVLVHAGAFRYVDRSSFLGPLGVPIWLPLLYACGAIGVGCLGRHLAGRS